MSPMMMILLIAGGLLVLTVLVSILYFALRGFYLGVTRDSQIFAPVLFIATMPAAVMLLLDLCGVTVPDIAWGIFSILFILILSSYGVGVTQKYPTQREKKFFDWLQS